MKEAAIMDELAHIPAGYGYVKYFDFRLNPEHPPLVKALAAFPLLFQDLKFPTDKSAWQSEINGQWAAGAQFLYESGNDADKIIRWSRVGPMILTLILIIFIYFWSKELIGRWWAYLPTFMFAISPAVLAHGHYVTTDLAAALGIFIATYYFVKLLIEPSQKHLIFAGLAFGLAQLMKFSAVLLIPFFLFLIVVLYIWKIHNEWADTAFWARPKKFFIRALRYLKNIALVFIIGYALVYAVYFIFTINYPIEKQYSDTKFILGSFAGEPDLKLETCKISSNIPVARRVRCLAEVNIWMSGNKIFRPMAEYMLGVLMVMQRSSGGNTGYFLGEVSAAGWWYYFPTVFALKEALPSLILIFTGLVLTLWHIGKRIISRGSKLTMLFDYIGTHFPEFSMISFVIFYWIYSIKSPLNIGFRHILPTVPFIYILTASAIKKWFNYDIVFEGKNILREFFNMTGKIMKMSAGGLMLTLLLIWYLLETLTVSPHFLSYFNQLGGGLWGGYKYVTDSNYDWGQDLKYLENFVNENKIQRIAVDYFGGGSARYYFGQKAEYWGSSRGNPSDYGINWIAISVNSLQGATGKLHEGQLRDPKDEYRWLQKIKNIHNPDAKAGTSIFIYKLK
ncbi:MAG: Glycosyl transferase family 39 [Candidatus Wolfebacteria bacterium GW2011_GWC1_37_10]|nr:MAG: Glycosyl transferase family 39 [Candidatus Wolfebacteria bacterium GW2011_GWC1_37_10]